MSKHYRLPRNAKASSCHSSPQSPPSHSSNDSSFASVSSLPQSAGVATVDASPVNIDRFSGSGSASAITGILADIAEENHSSPPPSPIQPSSLAPNDAPPPPPHTTHSNSLRSPERIAAAVADDFIMPLVDIDQAVVPDSQDYQYAQPRTSLNDNYAMYEALQEQVKTSFLAMLDLNARFVQMGQRSVTPPNPEILERLGISPMSAHPVQRSPPPEILITTTRPSSPQYIYTLYPQPNSTHIATPRKEPPPLPPHPAVPPASTPRSEQPHILSRQLSSSSMNNAAPKPLCSSRQITDDEKPTHTSRSSCRAPQPGPDSVATRPVNYS